MGHPFLLIITTEVITLQTCDIIITGDYRVNKNNKNSGYILFNYYDISFRLVHPGRYGEKGFLKGVFLPMNRYWGDGKQ